MSTAPAALDQAVRRLRRVAGLWFGWIVLRAVLAGILLAACAFCLLVVLVIVLPSGAGLISMIHGLLSIGGSLLAIFLLVRPLRMHWGLARQAVRLEEVSGETGDLLSALEFHRDGQGAESGQASPELVTSVGERALALLARIPRSSKYPIVSVRLCVWLNMGIFAVLAVGAGIWPEGARSALLAMAAGEIETRGPEIVEESMGAGDEVPSPVPSEPDRVVVESVPCSQIEVILSEPAYVGGGVRALPLNGRFPLLDGARLRFRCVAPGPDPRIELDRKTGDERVRVPLKLVSSRPGVYRFEAEIVVDGPEEVRLLRVLEDERGNVWHRGLWVVESQRDAPPACWLLEPRVKQAARSRPLNVEVEARDDWGVGRVLLEYRVLGIDEKPRLVELALIGDRRDVKIRDSVHPAALGAEGGQYLELAVRVEDAAPDPGVCRTRTMQVHIDSPEVEYRNHIIKLARCRDRGLDLLANLLELGSGVGLGRAWRLLDGLAGLPRLRDHLGNLARELADSAVVEQEVVRRLTEMEARLSEYQEPLEACWSGRRNKLGACLSEQVGNLLLELEQDSLALGDTLEALFNSYMVHWGQDLEQQRRTLTRQLGAGSSTSFQRDEAIRQAARIRSHLAELRDLSHMVRARLPASVNLARRAAARGQADWAESAAGELESLMAALREGRSGAELHAQQERLGRSIDGLNRAIEGEYARVLARTTEGFQERVGQLKVKIVEMQGNSRDLMVELKDFLDGWSRRIEGSLRPRLKRRWSEIGRQLGRLKRMSSHLDREAYLPLERQGIVQLRAAIRKLRQTLRKARIEEAMLILSDLREQLRAMTYSLRLAERYGPSEKLQRRVGRELERIRRMERSTEHLEDEVKAVMPLKKRLLTGPDKARLSQMVSQAEIILKAWVATSELLEEMKATFPALHARVELLLRQSRRGFQDSLRGLKTLDLESAAMMLSYAISNLASALVVLDEAARPARRGRVVLASGRMASTDLELGPGGKKDLMRYLERLEKAASVSIPQPWDRITRDYLGRLLP